MAHPRRRSRAPRQGEALLDGVFRRLGLADEARSYRALAAWAAAAGPHIGSRARAERLRGKTLFVRVVSSSWAQELGYLKAELIEKLNDEPGGESIDDLRFTVGPIDELPDFRDSHSEDAAAGAAPAPPAPAAPPSDESAAALAQVSDPELRATLQRLLGRATK